MYMFVSFFRDINNPGRISQHRVRYRVQPTISGAWSGNRTAESSSW